MYKEMYILQVRDSDGKGVTEGLFNHRCNAEQELRTYDTGEVQILNVMVGD